MDRVQQNTDQPVTVDAKAIYLVWSNEHNAWWAPNRAGYRSDMWAAGRYDEAGALDACGSRSWPDGVPPEVMVLAPEHGRELFTVTDIRRLPDLMRIRVEDATYAAVMARQGPRPTQVAADAALILGALDEPVVERPAGEEWADWDAAEINAVRTAYVAEYGPEIEAEAGGESA